MKYYRFLDERNRDEVVKENSERKYYQYSFGLEYWEPTEMMSGPWWMDHDYAEYEEISEAEALALIGEQSEKYNQLLKMAVSMAEDAYKGKKDKYGKPYIEHPRAAAETLPNIKYKIIIYLYNISKDTSITLEELKNKGFTYQIVNTVRLLAQRGPLTYEEYLNRLRLSDAGRAVKIAELKHSIEYMESNEMTDEDRVKTEKYKKSAAFLES